MQTCETEQVAAVEAERDALKAQVENVANFLAEQDEPWLATDEVRKGIVHVDQVGDALWQNTVHDHDGQLARLRSDVETWKQRHKRAAAEVRRLTEELKS